MEMLLLLNIFSIILLLVNLALLIVLLKKMNKEQFCNCVGVQYNGLDFLNNPNGPVCSKGIKSVYPDGGCLTYDPEQVAIDYMHGKFIPAV